MVNDLVSIIVPVYNAEKYLEDSVRSLIAQTYTNIEIIIVDDGSSDSSLTTAKKMALLDSRIKVYKKDNGGVSSARNYGLSVALGRYIALQDADDLARKDRIEKQLLFLRENRLDLCGCALHIFGSKEKEKIYPEKDSDLKFNLIFFGRTIAGPSILFDRKSSDGLTFDESISFGEDFDFILRFAFQKGIKIGNLKEAVYLYRQHSAQATQKLKATNKKNMIQIVFKFLDSKNVQASIGDVEQHFSICKEKKRIFDNESYLMFLYQVYCFSKEYFVNKKMWGRVLCEVFPFVKKSDLSGDQSIKFNFLYSKLPLYKKVGIKLRANF
ncbi:glycosyltransferase family 2 protein [Spongorhabdus nitratireducens]